MPHKNEPLFTEGECVRVKPLDELQREFGSNLVAECDFVETMHQYCGKTYRVKAVLAPRDHSNWYTLDIPLGWRFDERVLDYMEPSADSGTPVITMAYDELL